MKRPVQTRLAPLALACTSVFVACGPASPTGTGGPQTVGQPPGSACNPAYALQGCYGTSPVGCDPATNTWTASAPCPAGTYCVELPDPASPTSPKRVAHCQAPAGADAAAVDASAEDGGSLDAAGEDDVVSGPPCGDLLCEAGENASSCPVDCIEKLRDTLICIDGACGQAWTACAGQKLCLKTMNCIALCPDDACIKQCESLVGDGKAQLDAVLACTKCDG